MASETQLQDALVALNAALGDLTPYKLDVVDPRSLRHVEKNAHYMEKRVYDQLVGNIARDRNLSSLPFCWKRNDGRYIVLSGNHRVDAAIDAGMEQVLILFTDAELSVGERIAIQLSHNAIVGKDNPAVLRELWDRLDVLDLKVYSGLDEKLVATLEPVQVASLKDAHLRFENLTLLFVPAEIAHLELIVKEALAHVPKGAVWLGDVADFDRFFELLLDFKEAANVLNTATAFKLMVEVLDAWVQDRKAEAEAEAASAAEKESEAATA